MLNSEIDTYQLAEAIQAVPNLKVVLTKGIIKSKVNDRLYVGNFAVLKKAVNCKKLKKLKIIANNTVKIEKDAVEILSDIYGISKDSDYELLYNAETVWKAAQKEATKESKIKKSAFSLDEGIEENIL